MQSYKELLSQREALDKKIEELRTTALQAALDEARALVADFELTQEDVFGKQRKAQGKVQPKYRDPNTGKTWSGRGMAPLWIAGQDREKLAISP